MSGRTPALMVREKGKPRQYGKMVLEKPQPVDWRLQSKDHGNSSPRLDFLQEERLRRGVQLSGVEVSGPAPPAALCNMSSASQKKSFWAAIKGIQPTISFIFSIRSCNVGQLWIWLRYSSQAWAVPPGSWGAPAPWLGSGLPPTLLAGRSR